MKTANKYAQLSHKSNMIEASDELKEAIENALYATNAFTTGDCSLMAEGIIMYIKDAGFKIVKSSQKAVLAVSEEDLQRAANRHLKTLKINKKAYESEGVRYDFIEGAKWMREQLIGQVPTGKTETSNN